MLTLTKQIFFSACFWFSKLDKQKSRSAAEEISTRQEIFGVGGFSVLFFMWGLAYGLLDIMNYHIKVAMGISRQSAALMALSYYSAYIPGTLLIGGPLVKRCGYRLGAVVGLLFLATGDQFMSLGADNLSFGIMCFSHVVVGLGVSTLERVANAYVVNVGPRKRATLRILFAQSFAAIGTVIAPLLANNLILNADASSALPDHNPLDASRCIMPTLDLASESSKDLKKVVSFYRYLGAAIYCLALLFGTLFFRTTLVVEVTVPTSPPTTHSKLHPWRHPLVSSGHLRLWYGVAANFLNLGCQVTVAQFFIEHMRVNACQSDSWSTKFMTIAQTAFVVGRLIPAAFVALHNSPKCPPLLRTIFKPRLVLTAFLAGAVAFTAAGIVATSSAAIAFACLVMFFEAPSFPMIFESATAGFEKWTATAETLMILSISGGGLQPLLMGMLVDRTNVGVGWILVTACFGGAASYALMCNVVPGWRKALDGAHQEGKEETEMERRSGC